MDESVLEQLQDMEEQKINSDPLRLRPIDESTTYYKVHEIEKECLMYAFAQKYYPNYQPEQGFGYHKEFVQSIPLNKSLILMDQVNLTSLCYRDLTSCNTAHRVYQSLQHFDHIQRNQLLIPKCGGIFMNKAKVIPANCLQALLFYIVSNKKMKSSIIV